MTKQTDPKVTALAETDAYPADPEDGYGWEKLFSERMARHFREDYGLETRVARYHNVYGPLGTWEGGREKAPAALCRKVAEVALGHTEGIEIWGDGEQTRSFMYIDDCVRGTIEILAGDHVEPVNLGSAELVTINQMVDILEEIASVKVKRSYNLDAPQGVRGRNSDNTLFREIYGWEPSIPLKDGLERTYGWIYDQLAGRSMNEIPPTVVVHDFSGHPFQAELSRKLSERGFAVEHLSAGQYVSGKGHLERQSGDASTLTFASISLHLPFQKYAPWARLRWERAYGRAWVERLRQLASHRRHRLQSAAVLAVGVRPLRAPR